MDPSIDGLSGVNPANVLLFPSRGEVGTTQPGTSGECPEGYMEELGICKPKTQPSDIEGQETIVTPTTERLGKEGKCEDTDGDNPNTKGAATLSILNNPPGFSTGETQSMADICGDYTTLKEYLCSDNKLAEKTYTCDFGCDDGKCLTEGISNSEWNSIPNCQEIEKYDESGFARKGIKIKTTKSGVRTFDENWNTCEDAVPDLGLPLKAYNYACTDANTRLGNPPTVCTDGQACGYQNGLAVCLGGSEGGGVLESIWRFLFGWLVALLNPAMQAAPGQLPDTAQTECTNPPGHNPQITGVGNSATYYFDNVYTKWDYHKTATDDEKKQAAYFNAKVNAFETCSQVKCDLTPTEANICSPTVTFEDFDSTKAQRVSGKVDYYNPEKIESEENNEIYYTYQGQGTCNCGKTQLKDVNMIEPPQQTFLPPRILTGGSVPVLSTSNLCQTKNSIDNIHKDYYTLKEGETVDEEGYVKSPDGYYYTGRHPVGSGEAFWDESWTDQQKLEAKKEAFKKALEKSVEYCKERVNGQGQGCVKTPETMPLACEPGTKYAFTFDDFESFVKAGDVKNSPGIGSCDSDPSKTCVSYGAPGTCGCFVADEPTLQQCQGQSGIEAAVRGECSRIVFATE